jgi:hypothetical protein
VDTLDRRQAHAATQEPVEREYGAELVFRVLHIAGTSECPYLAIVHSEGLGQLQRWETNTDVSWAPGRCRFPAPGARRKTECRGTRPLARTPSSLEQVAEWVRYGRLGVRFLHLGWSRTSSNGGSSRSCRASADPPSPLGLAPRHVLEPSCGNTLQTDKSVTSKVHCGEQMCG